MTAIGSAAVSNGRGGAQALRRVRLSCRRQIVFDGEIAVPDERGCHPDPLLWR